MTDEAIAALLRTVAAQLGRTAPPAGPLDGERVRAYLGDVVRIAFDGADDERVALLARLVLLARAARPAPRDDALPPLALVRRLERSLRRRERELRGAVRPLPRADELEARLAMFAAATAPDPVIGLDTVALGVAELVAIRQLAGGTSVERATAARSALEPLAAAGAALLRGGATPPPGEAVFARPGATLAHVDRVSWQIERVLARNAGREELRWLRERWVELAAALVFALDAYDRRDDHAARWREVLDLAAELATGADLLGDPSRFDALDALALARSAALALAAWWLDEQRDAATSVEGPGAGAMDRRVGDAAAKALLAAWIADRRLAETSGER